jgi:hypothetical protein
MNTENSNPVPEDGEDDTLENRVITFSINDAAIAEVAEDFKDIDAFKDLPAAKTAKKSLVKMRSTLGEAHKEAKADALAYGRRCDAEKNRLLELIGEIEDPITEDLDSIKNAAALEEQQRLDKIMEGIEQIQAFALDRHDLSFDQLNERLDTLLALKVDPLFYAEQTEDAENAKEVSESKLRIALMNEETRLKEAAEKEELARKNKELQDEIDRNNAERAERDAEQKVKDDAAAVERKAELDKQAEEVAAAQVKIDAENKRLADDEAERLATKRAEEAKAAEDLAAEIAAVQAPDKDKLVLFAQAVDHLVGVKPVLQSDLGNDILLEAIASLLQIRTYIEKRSEEL